MNSNLSTGQFSQAHRLYGSGDVDALFNESPMTAAPFPAAGRVKSRKDYDPDVVKGVLTNPDHPLEDVDPRTLHSTQPNVTRAGVQHYMGGATTPYADQHNVGNTHPVVYDREDGTSLLLSGHHRAAAALLQGRPLRARRVAGPWGPPRSQR